MQATNIERAPLYPKLPKLAEQSRKCAEVGDLQCPKQAICSKKTAAESTAAAGEKSSSDQTKPNSPFPSALPGRSGQRHPQQPTPTAQTQAKSQRQHRKLVLTPRKNRSFTPKTAHSKSYGNLQVSRNRAQCREQPRRAVARK